jgi:hypothetical protein
MLALPTGALKQDFLYAISTASAQAGLKSQHFPAAAQM